MVDQTTLGHRMIKQQFGVTPKVTWQIDPFGHSTFQASMMSSQISGFNGLFFGRIDYSDMALRRHTKTMEMVWAPSESLGPAYSTFAGVLDNLYFPPSECAV